MTLRVSKASRVFALLLVLCFSFSVTPAHAENEHGVPSECGENFGQGLSSDDLYGLLGRRDASSGESAKLFEEASQHSNVRAHLNEQIAKQEYLQAASEIGLKFKTSFEEFLLAKTLRGSSDIRSVLYPRKHLSDLYEQFKKTLKNMVDAPLVDPEAALLARYDTANRYGLDPSYTQQDIQYRDDLQDIQFFYNRQFNRYLLSDKEKYVFDPNVDLRRFRIWLRKTDEFYLQERAKNLIEALVQIAKFDRSSLKFSVSVDGKKVKGAVKFTEQSIDEIEAKVYEDLTAAQKSDVPTTQVVLSPRAKYLQSGSFSGIDKKNFWRRNLGQYVAYPDQEKIRFLKLLKKKEVNAPDDVIRFTSVDKKFNDQVAKHLGIQGAATGKEVEYVILIKDVYALLDVYTDVLMKTTFEEASDLANKLLLTFYYEQALALNSELLNAQIQQPKIKQFESELKSTAYNELHDFDGKNPTVSTENLFQRMRRMVIEQPNDAMTGVEWFGYRIHNNFWKNRDARYFKNLNRPLKRFFAPVRDLISKAKRSTQAIVATTALSVAMYIALPYLQDIVSLLAAESGIENMGLGGHDGDRQATGGGGGHSRGKSSKGGGKNQVIFDTKAWYTNTQNYYEGGYAEAPMFFDYASVYELKDTAHLQQFVLDRDLVQSKVTGENVAHVVDLKTTDSTQMSPVGGYLMVPRPEDGFEIFDLSVRDTATGRKDVGEGIFIHPKTGQYLLKLKPEFRDSSHFDVHAKYVKSKPRREAVGSLENFVKKVLNEVAHSENRHVFKDKRFAKMNVHKLRTIIDSVRSAGLVDLADQYENMFHLADSLKHNVTLDDVANVIAYTQIYKMNVPELDTAAKFNNPFERWKSYLKMDSISGKVKLHFKCNTSNTLYTEILRQYFADQPDVIIEPYRSHVMDSSELRPRASSGQLLQDGWIHSIGHERTQVITHAPGTLILDATPITAEPQPEEPKKPEPPPVEKPWWLQWPEAPDPRRKPWFPDPQTIVLESDEFHRIKVRELTDKAEMILANPTMIQLSRQSRQTLLPNRIYILAKEILAFANRETDVATLYRRLYEIYPDLGLVIPADQSQMLAIFTKIEAYETQNWETLQKYAEEKSGASTRINISSAWSEDLTLKRQIFDLIAVLKSYHWHAPVPKGGN